MGGVSGLLWSTAEPPETSHTSGTVLVFIVIDNVLAPLVSKDPPDHASIEEMTLHVVLVREAQSFCSLSLKLTNADSPATTKYHGVTGEHARVDKEYGSLTIGAGQLPSGPQV